MANTWGVGSLLGVESGTGEFISGSQSTWGVGSLVAQESSLGLLTSGPWVRSVSPVSAACQDSATVTGAIEIAVGGGDLIDQGTILIEVTTNGGTTWANVYASSAFDSAWTGSAANSTDGLLDVWTFTGLRPVAGYSASTEYIFRINADDDNGDSMSEATFAFDTCPIVAATLVPTTVEKDGGYLISATVSSTSLPPGIYRAYIGGTQCGDVLTATVSGANSTVVIPSPKKASGSYDLRLVGLNVPVDLTFASAVTLVPHLFRSQEMSLKGKLSRLWDLGYRDHDDEEIPQS